MKFRLPLAAGLLAVLASAPATSAPRESAGPRVQAFGVAQATGQAKISEPVGRGKGKPPKALSIADKGKLLHDAYGIDAEVKSTYARVDPSRAEVEGKAALVFVGAEVVNAAQGFASWEPLDAGDVGGLANAVAGQHPRYAGLWIKGEGPGSRYLVDCSMWSDRGQFQVKFDDGRR